MFYKIAEKLEECSLSSFKDVPFPFVAVLSSQEWENNGWKFDMGIEADLSLSNISSTKAEVNYDSLTGSFCLPDRANVSGPQRAFAFALDEKGVVFIDDKDTASGLIAAVAKTKKLAFPCMERFLYDFLEAIIHKDQTLIEHYDRELDGIEAEVLSGDIEEYPTSLIAIRSDLRDLRVHYEQLLDLCQELEENENNFFKEENLRYFHMVGQRIETLHGIVASQMDHVTQVRELYQAQLDIRLNRIMTILTVVTSIFMPLTLITGWYGMNFVYMPELHSPTAYPAVFLTCIVIVAISLIFFKKKKWL